MDSRLCLSNKIYVEKFEGLPFVRGKVTRDEIRMGLDSLRGSSVHDSGVRDPYLLCGTLNFRELILKASCPNEDVDSRDTDSDMSYTHLQLHYV